MFSIQLWCSLLLLVIQRLVLKCSRVKIFLNTAYINLIIGASKLNWTAILLILYYILFISRNVAEQLFITSGQMRRMLLILSITQHILQVHIINYSDNLYCWSSLSKQFVTGNVKYNFLDFIVSVYSELKFRHFILLW